MTYGVIVLAAGVGRRYRQSGGSGEKLLARYPDAAGKPQPLLMLTLANACATGMPVTAVCRPESAELQALVRHAGAQPTLLASRGSGESIAAGVKAMSDLDGWLIVPGDMGWVTAQDYLRVRQALLQGHRQVRLACDRQPGHPVGFAADYRQALLALTDDDGAKRLLNRETLLILQAPERVIRDADLFRAQGG